MTPIELTATAGHLVQAVNTIHVECQKGNFRVANELLALHQAQVQSFARELWLSYYTSGEQG